MNMIIETFRKLKNNIYRLVTAWIITAALTKLIKLERFTEKDYYRGISFILMIALVLLLWLLLCEIRSEGMIALITALSALVYVLDCVLQEKSLYFAFGACVLILGLILFSAAQYLPFNVGNGTLWTLAVLLIVIFTVWVGGLCALMYLHNGTPSFDFGIFTQMFYYMKKTGLPLTTCERDGLLSHFHVHMSPVFYLFLPVYALFPSPVTLQVLQALIVAAGIIPLILLCRHYRLSNKAALAFSVIYFSYPAFIGGCFYFLHENNFLAPLVLFMFLAFEKKKVPGIIISSLLVLSVKEDAAVYVVVCAFYFLIRDGLPEETSESRDVPDWLIKSGSRLLRSTPFWVMIISGLYFVIIVSWLSRFGDGAMTGRYDNYIYDNSGSLMVMLKAIIENPMYVIQQCFTTEKIFSTFMVLVPLAFLPLLMHSAKDLFLLIPYLLWNMMSGYFYQHEIGYQYYFGSGAFLFYMAVVNYSKLKKNTVVRKLLAAGMCAGLILSLSRFQDSLVDYYPSWKAHTEERDNTNEILDKIPKDASVCCSDFLLPRLSDRKEVYLLSSVYLYDTDYIIIDIRGGENQLFDELSVNEDYELEYYTEHAAAAFRRK